MKFGREFEALFLTQSLTENRSIIQMPDLGSQLLSMLPRNMLDRVAYEPLNEHYKPKA